MTGAELYEKHKGREAREGMYQGIVCGHGENYMIMAVTNGSFGWNPASYDNIITHKDNEDGFWTVREKDLIFKR